MSNWAWQPLSLTRLYFCSQFQHVKPRGQWLMPYSHLDQINQPRFIPIMDLINVSTQRLCLHFIDCPCRVHVVGIFFMSTWALKSHYIEIQARKLSFISRSCMTMRDTHRGKLKLNIHWEQKIQYGAMRYHSQNIGDNMGCQFWDDSYIIIFFKARIQKSIHSSRNI